MFAKRIRSTLLAAAVMACAMASAIATPLSNQVYVSTDNKAFSLVNVQKIISDPAGFITLNYVGGESSYTYLQDTGGVVFAQIKAQNPALTSIAAASGVLYNLSYAKYTACNSSGGVLMIGWSVGGSEWVNDPGCVTINGLKNAPH